MFADDVKAYLEIVNSNDASKLQCALDLITWWADEWQLRVSVSKCNILTIGKSQGNRKQRWNRVSGSRVSGSLGPGFGAGSGHGSKP